MQNNQKFIQKLIVEHNNDEQQLGIITSNDNRIIVEAAAGSGKTKVLISSIAYRLITNKITSTKKILALTFSVNAAYKIKKDVIEKIPKLIGKNENYENDISKRISISNYHGLSRKILDYYGGKILFIDKNFNLIKTLSDEDLIKLNILDEHQKEIIDIFSKSIKNGDYKEYKKVIDDIENTKEMLNDPDLKDIASEELTSLENRKEELNKKLEILLVPKDENDGKDVIMEIRGAAGGDEANIFAGDLFRMYSYYAEKNGWKIEVLHCIEGTSGGFSQIEYIVKGKDVYSKLKYESGSHRVQRVPETENQGRVHTSTATVLVMPKYDNVSININENDLKIDVYHSSGAGGQSVNTSNSAVRITHLPSKIVVAVQNERSQLRNKEIAMEILKNKLYLLELEKNETLTNKLKNNDSINFGSQIRSYILEPYKLVKDYRTNFESNDPESILNGEIMDMLIYNVKEMK